MNFSSRHCDYCEVNWPMNKEYTACPLCAYPTEVETGVEPLSQVNAKAMIFKQAAIMKKRRDFDEWYETRELTRFRAELEAYEAVRDGS